MNFIFRSRQKNYSRTLTKIRVQDEYVFLPLKFLSRPKWVWYGYKYRVLCLWDVCSYASGLFMYYLEHSVREFMVCAVMVIICRQFYMNFLLTKLKGVWVDLAMIYGEFIDFCLFQFSVICWMRAFYFSNNFLVYWLDFKHFPCFYS